MKFIGVWLLLISLTLIGGDSDGKLPNRCSNLEAYMESAGQNTTYQLEEQAPNTHHKSDHGFELRLRRLTDGVMIDEWFEPGRNYLVTLENRYESVGFREALIWIKEQLRTTDLTHMFTSGGDSALDIENNYCFRNSSNYLGSWLHLTNKMVQANGLIEQIDSNTALTRKRSGCAGRTVERRHRAPRIVTKMIAIWHAPDLINCKEFTKIPCVTINALVKPHDVNSGILKTSGGLVKTLCPSAFRPPSPVLPAFMVPRKRNSNDGRNTQMHDNEKPMKLAHDQSMHLDSMQPQDCCACGSATYNLTFQGLWTRKTHPKDWPVHSPGLLHWTNLIGASHSPGYQIYRYGDLASAGVQAVCMYGDTTVMKQSLGVAAANTASFGGVPSGTQRGAIGIGPLHSLVSSPGMWSEETLSETRSTLIGVNRTHPLISFLTMLGPSPNWCAGISGQSVCQADCTWVKRIEMDLYPWDAGVRYGDTYLPKESERKDIPDPIRVITRDWMPNAPFTPDLPVAHITLERVLPKEAWECTSTLADGVEIFRSDGSTEMVGHTLNLGKNKYSPAVQSVVGDLTGNLPKKSRQKSNRADGPTNARASNTGLGGDSPLSDPSLAQMATFLCIVDSWSQWTPCSVTCGVGRRTRQRVMLLNKKNELCQHVPLREEEACEGRKRTCDFSAPCSLLPWTDWSPCNATCEKRNGQQTRRRYLARAAEKPLCDHLFRSNISEDVNGTLYERRQCGPTELECDPVTICGEGRKDGLPCGKESQLFYYSAVEHACLPFNYLGCKGGRNQFKTKEACERFCIEAVESLPAWRRERMALLQYQTSQLAREYSNSGQQKHLKPADHCTEPMDPGERCPHSENNLPQVKWYFCVRTRRCREFVYLGCGGNKNNYGNYTHCLSDCLPKEMDKALQMTKARVIVNKKTANGKEQRLDEEKSMSYERPVDEADLSSADIQRIDNLWGPKQDCKLTHWTGWGPCSTRCPSKGTQLRWRFIERPARYGGKPCGVLFDKRECMDTNCRF